MNDFTVERAGEHCFVDPADFGVDYAEVMIRAILRIEKKLGAVLLPADAIAITGKLIREQLQLFLEGQALVNVQRAFCLTFADFFEQRNQLLAGEHIFKLCEHVSGKFLVVAREFFQPLVGQPVYKARTPDAVAFFLRVDQAFLLKIDEMVPHRDAVNPDYFSEVANSGFSFRLKNLKYFVTCTSHICFPNLRSLQRISPGLRK
ncbi:MAG TPA: hypothetical protein PKW57_01505 [Anaerolineaceae bacterium]|nr:hypothetical protein [Anaerolineaceae bacterium]